MAIAVAEAVHESPRLSLIGVTGYEGAVAHGTAAGRLATVDRYLDELAALHLAVSPLYDVSRAGAAMVTVGGSEKPACVPRPSALISATSDQQPSR